MTFVLEEISATNVAGEKIELRTVPLELTIKNGIAVWPGDADNNGRVDQADIMPLGFYWNQTGEPRTNASLQWSAQTCPVPWIPEAATCADCNGDGIVNHQDIMAIGFNWNETHDLGLHKESLANEVATDGQMLLSCTGDGSELSPYCLFVELADVSNLLGLSFSLIIEQTDANVLFSSVEYRDFLGADILHFEVIDNDQGKISIGATRKAPDGGVSGGGALCCISFTVEENSEGDAIRFSIIDVSANDVNGEALQLKTASTNMFTGINQQAVHPEQFALHQNYPNPFNPSTINEYDVPDAAHIKLDIYNSLGQRITSLVDAPHNPGRYRIQWDGRTNSGQNVSPGIYIGQIKNENGISKRIKMIFTK